MRFDTVPSGRPAWSGRKGARHYRSEFIGTDGSLPLGWLGGVGDDRRSFGTRVLVARSAPVVRLSKADALAQQDGPDLAAFDADARLFGGLHQGIETKLR